MKPFWRRKVINVVNEDYWKYFKTWNNETYFSYNIDSLFQGNLYFKKFLSVVLSIEKGKAC